jgi:hypothetical protein
MLGLLFGLGFASVQHVVSLSSLRETLASSEELGIGIAAAQPAAEHGLAESSTLSSTPPGVPVTLATIDIVATPPAPPLTSASSTAPKWSASGTSVVPRPASKRLEQARDSRRAAAKTTGALVRQNPYIDLMPPY